MVSGDPKYPYGVDDEWNERERAREERSMSTQHTPWIRGEEMVCRYCGGKLEMLSYEPDQDGEHYEEWECKDCGGGVSMHWTKEESEEVGGEG